MKHYIVFIIILLCGSANASPVINSHIEPSTARVGETLQLTLTLDNAQTSGTPDLTPLQKDFIITGTQASLSYSAINGVAKSTNTWVIQLIAKKSGVINLPPLQVGHLSSMPTRVNITDHANELSADKENAPSDDNAPIMLRTNANPTTPFINEQVIYTVKLYSRQSVLEADYQPPHVDDALLIPLGEGRRYQTTLNGYGYNVDEQQYAIFPQKSGKLHINPPTLTAVVYDGAAKHLHIKGDATNLNVAPIPASNTSSHWLPAKQVGLTERFEPSTTSINQGDTIVRTIRLQAMAMPAELLPTLTFAESKQFSVYPEKPETHNTLRQQTLIGTTTTKVTYLLNKTGPVTIPPLKLTWFNTQTGLEEVITLPAHKLTVAAKPGSAAPPPSKPTVVHKKPMTPILLTVPKQSHALLYWIASALGLAGLLMALLRWLRPRFLARRTMKTTLKQLRTACAANDPTSAHSAFLSWAALVRSDAMNDSEINKQIQLLSQVLYSPSPHNWDGKALWLAVKHYRPMPALKTPYRLPPIHPI